MRPPTQRRDRGILARQGRRGEPCREASKRSCDPQAGCCWQPPIPNGRCQTGFLLPRAPNPAPRANTCSSSAPPTAWRGASASRAENPPKISNEPQLAPARSEPPHVLAPAYPHAKKQLLQCHDKGCKTAETPQRSRLLRVGCPRNCEPGQAPLHPIHSRGANNRYFAAKLRPCGTSSIRHAEQNRQAKSPSRRPSETGPRVPGE